MGSIQPVVMPGPLLSRTSNGHTVNLYRNPLDYEDEGSDHYGQKNSDEDSAEDEV